MWSAAKQTEYRRTYESNPTKYADWKNSAEVGGKWAGHWVTDCSGLFAWSFSELGGKMYHGATTMYNSWCTAKGAMKGGRRTDGNALLPGTAVFTGNESKKNHVGLYIGNGKVIEAQGSNAGVVESSVSLSKWTYWGEMKGVIYGGEQSMPEEEKVEKGYAVVTGKQVALRRGPSTGAAVITRIATGKQVKIAEPPTDWAYVEYEGKQGYMMKEFLKEGE